LELLLFAFVYLYGHAAGYPQIQLDI
jgi:hypothetical protein